LDLKGFNASSSFVEEGGKMDINTKPSFSVKNYTSFTFSPAQKQMAVSVSKSSLLVLGDTNSMDTMFAPLIPGADGSTYFLVSTNQTILVRGPALLRNASITKDESTVDLWGDTNRSTAVTVYAPESVTSALWNGRRIANVHSTAPGVLEFSVGGLSPKIRVPDLWSAKWKVADGLPEIQKNYDDSRWVEANRLNSTNPFGKYYGDVSGSCLQLCLSEFSSTSALLVCLRIRIVSVCFRNDLLAHSGVAVKVPFCGEGISTARDRRVL
jgi:hypothetical protein